jgi:hypothetical protein
MEKSVPGYKDSIDQVNKINNDGSKKCYSIEQLLAFFLTVVF